METLTEGRYLRTGLSTPNFTKGLSYKVEFFNKIFYKVISRNGKIEYSTSKNILENFKKSGK